MEYIELQATLVAYATEVTIKEQALRTKQQNEMEVLLQRVAQGRDELRMNKNLDLDRCSQVSTATSISLLNLDIDIHIYCLG